MVECIRARAGSLIAAPGPVAAEMQWLPEPQTWVKPSAAPLLWSACSFTVGKTRRQSRMQWGGADCELSCAVECPPFVVSQRVVVINNSGRGFHSSRLHWRPDFVFLDRPGAWRSVPTPLCFEVLLCLCGHLLGPKMLHFQEGRPETRSCAFSFC